MELAERMLESAEDMTAAETAPRPTNDTAVGVRYWSTMGSTSDLSNSAVWLVAFPVGLKKSVLVQSRVDQQKLHAYKLHCEKGCTSLVHYSVLWCYIWKRSFFVCIPFFSLRREFVLQNEILGKCIYYLVFIDGMSSFLNLLYYRKAQATVFLIAISFKLLTIRL